MSERVNSAIMSVSVSAGADFNSGCVEIKGLQCFSIQAAWTGLDAADAPIKVQLSNDNSNWDDYPSSTATLAATPDNEIWEFVGGSACNWVRCVYTKNSVTAGTISITATLVSEA